MGFRYPTGARPLLAGETARRRRIEARFVSLLEAAGYAEIVLPIIDFAEPYAPLIDRGASRHSYRFVDRDGEIVCLRSDFTPMVARALAPVIDPAAFPLRVFYRGEVIRCGTTRLGAGREMFQIGAELIGDGSLQADREMLQLVSTIASAFVREPVIVHTSPDIEGFVYHASEDAESAGYYTGLRFWLYGDGRRTPFAQGGRYDSLYGRFGAGAPALGFTFTIDGLED